MAIIHETAHSADRQGWPLAPGAGIRAVVFDWGDTLMRVFPQHSGPMAGWPEVAATPGAAEALAALAGRYRLALATNAQDSDPLAIRTALGRAGLDRYLDTVVTARELGFAKPAAEFFRGALRRLGSTPDQAVMVGDSYELDVAGAKAAGLKALWYNPGRAACPEAHPAYDAEIVDMRALPAAVAGLRLPDIPTCLAWLAEQGASAGLVRHLRLVAAVAFRLAERLAAAGEPVDPLAAHRGALLHDLAKVSAQGTGVQHDDRAGQILRERRLPDLARIAERHAVWALVDPAKRPETWEERLVCYADRLADGDRLLGVEARLSALLRRRPDLVGEVARYRAAALALEAEIAGRLEVTPQALFAWVREQVAA